MQKKTGAEKLADQIKNAGDQIKRAWDDNPVGTLTAGALAVTAVAKLIDSFSAAQGRRAYAKQVNYRVKNRQRYPGER